MFGQQYCDVLGGERGDDVLDSYSTESLEELRRLIDPAGSNAPAGAPGWVSDNWPAIGTSIPATGDQLESLATQLGRRS